MIVKYCADILDDNANFPVGKLGKAIGAKINPDTGIVGPMVQTGSLVNKRQRKPAPGALAMLEDEIAARRGFWRRQRQREVDLNSRVAALAQVRYAFI